MYRSKLAGSPRALTRWVVLGLLSLALGFQSSARAVPIADSVADFSGVQTQGGWEYGFFNQGPAAALANYTVAGFQQFNSFSAGEHFASGQVGAQNEAFLSLTAEGGHPTGIGPDLQDSLIWAVRRYTSPIMGPLLLDIDLRKSNILNPDGGGITGRIFVDGVSVFEQLIENDDGLGVQANIFVNVNAGSVIDFAIDATGIAPPSGRDGALAARADGSIFTAQISLATASEPASIGLLALGLVGIVRVHCRGRRQG